MVSPESLGRSLIFPDQRVDVQIKHGLDDGEDGEDDGGHGDGGEAGHPAQAVRDTLGGAGLTPGQGEDPPDHQEEEQHYESRLGNITVIVKGKGCSFHLQQKTERGGVLGSIVCYG